ncbi:efflux RND transporter periplasmic adaptor subunit [Methylocella sp.]|uniref:efflux RND transporter periplasmic adaptor subunit n=1 Tax=Methylocella sp. TaxID=1978226 RepID=UPI0037835E2C
MRLLEISSSPLKRLRTGLLAAAAALALAACDDAAKPGAAPGAALATPEVGYVVAKEEPLPHVRELPGRVVPTRVAEVRARVTGLIVERAFEQGSVVKEGDLLYRLDRAPFEVELASAQASLAKTEAALTLARQQAERLAALLPKQAASQAQYDVAAAGQAQAEAEVAGAKAARDRAMLNLGYADVRAPISGRIGRALITEGALVEALSGTPLATIQQIDPIYVDITQSVGDLIKLRRDLASGELSQHADGAASVELALSDGGVYQQRGRLLFSDVTADPSTGQVTLRVKIPNPDGELFPGMYVRARIEQAIDADAIIVPQQAVQRTADGRSQVWVIRDDDRVMLQPVELGQVVGANWVIRSGLRPGQRIVVDGFQKITAGAQVRAVTQQAEADATAAPQTPGETTLAGRPHPAAPSP